MPLGFDECVKWLAGVAEAARAIGDGFYIVANSNHLVMIRIYDIGRGSVSMYERTIQADEYFAKTLNEFLVDESINVPGDVFELMVVCVGVWGVGYSL